jgi:Protein of unknown function (DUF4236)
MKIMPGVRLNLGTRGVSVSMGGRGLRTTVGRQGVRTTLGLPGTGISYSHLDKWGAPRRGRATPSSSPAPRTPPRQATVGEGVAFVAVLALVGVLAGMYGHWLVAALALALAAFSGWAVGSVWRTRRALSARRTGIRLAATTASLVPPSTAPVGSGSAAGARLAKVPSTVSPVHEPAASATCASALPYAHLCESPDAVRALLTSGSGAPLSELSAALALHDHSAVVTLLNRATTGRG